MRAQWDLLLGSGGAVAGETGVCAVYTELRRKMIYLNNGFLGWVARGRIRILFWSR